MFVPFPYACEVEMEMEMETEMETEMKMKMKSPKVFCQVHYQSLPPQCHYHYPCHQHWHDPSSSDCRHSVHAGPHQQAAHKMGSK